jgi:hypothetical protein
MIRLLFLDIDGPLTTEESRTEAGYEAFDYRAVEAFNYLLSAGDPHLCVVHSSWRKLPEPGPGAWAEGGGYFWSHQLWRELCAKQGLKWNLALEDAPFKFSSDRGHEIGFWLEANPWAEEGARLVIVDDDMHLIRPHPYASWTNTLLLECDDAGAGFTMSQARQAVDFWESP